MNLDDKIKRALLILRKCSQDKECHLAYSGGKDSDTILALAQMSGIKFTPYYYNVTIDPPELVRYIREQHADIQWLKIKPRFGNMLTRLANRKSLPPTRGMRWCCYEYKGHGIRWDKPVIVGVRKEESTKRAKYVEYSRSNSGDMAIRPIVDWTMEDVWEFLHRYNLPYCELYDEGWDRLGCVGCPLPGPRQQDIEFARWPKYEENWKRAIIRNWENFHSKLKRNGKPYKHATFASGESLWRWWRSGGRER